MASIASHDALILLIARIRVDKIFGNDNWLASPPYKRLIPELAAASAYCWHSSAFTRYRSDRDDIKPSRFISDMRRNDLQSAKVWREPADSVFG